MYTHKRSFIELQPKNGPHVIRLHNQQYVQPIIFEFLFFDSIDRISVPNHFESYFLNGTPRRFEIGLKSKTSERYYYCTVRRRVQTTNSTTVFSSRQEIDCGFRRGFDEKGVGHLLFLCKNTLKTILLPSYRAKTWQENTFCFSAKIPVKIFYR